MCSCAHLVSLVSLVSLAGLSWHQQYSDREPGSHQLYLTQLSFSYHASIWGMWYYATLLWTILQHRSAKSRGLCTFSAYRCGHISFVHSRSRSCITQYMLSLIRATPFACFAGLVPTTCQVGLTKAVPFLLENKLKELGAEHVKGDPWSPFVVQDSRLITGQNPQSSEETAKKVVEALGK